MQGGGAFGLEAVVSSTIPHDGGLLVIANGACAERLSALGADEELVLR